MDNNLEDVIWKFIDTYFQDNPQGLVRHHIESYNDFFNNGIFQIFRETNPMKLEVNYDETIQEFRSSCKMYFGGKDGSKIYFGKPTIHDDNNSHYMFPNEARLRNMTYGMTIHYDVDIEYTRILTEDEIPTILDDKGKLVGGDFEDSLENDPEMQQALSALDKIGGAAKKKKSEMSPADAAKMVDNTQKTMISKNVQFVQTTIEKVYLGKFPIMLQSDFCILKGLSREARFALGECKNDLGGYFIIDGKEKTVIPQEKFGDNMLYVKEIKPDRQGKRDYMFSAEIRSVSENVSKPIRTLSVKMVAPSASYSNKNIVVNIPNVRKPVPLFIVFRALGILTDKEIISMCLLQTPESPEIINWFLPSIHDAAIINTQEDALLYISLLIKGKTIANAMHVLADYFLPHVGEVNFMAKAYHLGYIVQRLMLVASGVDSPVDRDNYKYKRVELVGNLMGELFRTHFKKQQNMIRVQFETIYELNKATYSNVLQMVDAKYREVFREKMVDNAFKKAFKGNWGPDRIGVVQDLNRLSFNGMISHLRKTNLPLDSSVKLVGPRILHGSQWGIIDPIDTPDGANIGIHKHLSIMTYVTRDISREPMIEWIKRHVRLYSLNECTPNQLGNMTKLMVNGFWAGSIKTPIQFVQVMRNHRRQGLIPITTSISFDIPKNSVLIYTDGGRLCRPILYSEEDSGKFPWESNHHDWEKIAKGGDTISWDQLISGFHEKAISNYNPLSSTKIYEWEELYKIPKEKALKNKALIDYLDTSESEYALIALNPNDLELKRANHKYTHMELHESTTYGVMCNLINNLQNNPPTRNSFSCGQSKQAVSLYHTNYHVRMDKTSVILNNGQIPLVKSKYLKHINHEENPYGENAIVAVMCFTGYNVEDAMLVNEASLKRGLFRTTYFTTYEAHEEKEERNKIVFDKTFTNVESILEKVVGIKHGFDYSLLDENGMIRENTEVNDQTVLIGLTTSIPNSIERKDSSKVPKKGQLGYVDKSFMTESEEGKRIAKVRIREERIPAMGDKMASRAGQKGTIGMVIPEADMPFTKDGIRPDIIMNPHALPSRMTIGQMVECLTGKACALHGAFGDCTAFGNRESKIGVFGEILSKHGFHSSGNEILYDGMSGKQLESEIFMGPTYYMRLKHMVKDKINYRGLGPMTNLTRQPVSGRANDGGLRIGEMERDAVISHGLSKFLTESMMERGDKYQFAVCNKTGMIAIYNPAKNTFLSPMADGPIKYIGSGEDMAVQQISRFGRDFSIISAPYSFKLMIQELQGLNVRLSIITEDNISHIENMGFSKNLDKLMHMKGASPQMVIDDVNNKMNNKQVQNLNMPPVNKVKPKTEVLVSPYVEQITPPRPEEAEDIYEYTYVNKTREPIPMFDNINYGGAQPFVNPIVGVDSVDIGGGEKEEVLKVGSVVHRRGDNKPERIWKIQHIGKQFYTIDTEDSEGLPVSEMVQVVNPAEIYQPGDYNYVPIMMDYENQPPPPIMSGDLSSLSLLPEEPKINFAPVIKIFNEGNDMSSSGNGQGQEQYQGQVQDQQPTIVMKGGGEVLASSSSISSSSSPLPSSNTTGGSTNQIDFNKGLIIVKKE